MRTLSGKVWGNLKRLARHTGVKVAALLIVVGVSTGSMLCNKAQMARQQPQQSQQQHAEGGSRLVMLWTKIGADERVQTSPADFVYWREQNKLFEEMGAFAPGRVDLTEGGTAQKIYRGSISASLLSVLGVEPALGRNFLPAEDRPGNGRVVILSHDFWQRRFNSDPNVTKKTVSLNGSDYKIVGVMPPGFAFPRPTDIPEHFQFPRDVSVWTPLAYDPADLNRGFRFLTVAARLKPGVTVEQAQAEMVSISRRLQEQYPRTNANLEVTVVPLQWETAAR